MSTLEIGIKIGAYGFIAYAAYLTLSHLLDVVRSLSAVLKTCLSPYKHSNAHYHSYTQSILANKAPELIAAKTATQEKRTKLIQHAIDLLEAETNDAIRVQLQTQLRAKL